MANYIYTVPYADLANSASFADTANTANTANYANSTDTANYAQSANNASYATHAGTVLTNAQPNITSVGTLSNLVVSGFANLTNYVNKGTADLGSNSNVRISGGSAGQVLTTNGSGSLYWSTGGYGDANVANFLPNYTGILSGNQLQLSGNLFANNANITNFVIANIFQGNAANIVGNSQAGNIIVNNSIISNNVNVNSQIKTTSLIANGNITAGNANLGNLVIANFIVGNLNESFGYNGSNIIGAVALANDANFAYSAGNAANATYADAAAYATNAGHSQTANTVTNPYQSNITLVGTLENVTVAGTVFSNNLSGNIVTSTQPFITSLGNLTSLNVIGNLTAGKFIGNGSLLTGITADVANTVKNNAQPNITSIGTLTGLTVNGTSNLGPAGNVKITGGLNGYYLQSDGTGNLSWAPGTGSGNGVAAGANTQIQFTDGGGNFEANAGFTFEKDTGNLEVPNWINSGQQNGNAYLTGWVRANSLPTTSLSLGSIITAVDNVYYTILPGTECNISTTTYDILTIGNANITTIFNSNSKPGFSTKLPFDFNGHRFITPIQHATAGNANLILTTTFGNVSQPNGSAVSTSITTVPNVSNGGKDAIYSNLGWSNDIYLNDVIISTNNDRTALYVYYNTANSGYITKSVESTANYHPTSAIRWKYDSNIANNAQTFCILNTADFSDISKYVILDYLGSSNTLSISQSGNVGTKNNYSQFAGQIGASYNYNITYSGYPGSGLGKLTFVTWGSTPYVPVFYERDLPTITPNADTSFAYDIKFGGIGDGMRIYASCKDIDSANNISNTYMAIGSISGNYTITWNTFASNLIPTKFTSFFSNYSNANILIGIQNFGSGNVPLVISSDKGQTWATFTTTSMGNSVSDILLAATSSNANLKYDNVYCFTSPVNPSTELGIPNIANVNYNDISKDQYLKRGLVYIVSGDSTNKTTDGTFKSLGWVSTTIGMYIKTT